MNSVQDLVKVGSYQIMFDQDQTNMSDVNLQKIHAAEGTLSNLSVPSSSFSNKPKIPHLKNTRSQMKDTRGG